MNKVSLKNDLFPQMYPQQALRPTFMFAKPFGYHKVIEAFHRQGMHIDVRPGDICTIALNDCVPGTHCASDYVRGKIVLDRSLQRKLAVESSLLDIACEPRRKVVSYDAVLATGQCALDDVKGEFGSSIPMARLSGRNIRTGVRLHSVAQLEFCIEGTYYDFRYGSWQRFPKWVRDDAEHRGDLTCIQAIDL